MRRNLKTSLHLFYLCSSVVNPFITLLGKPDYKTTLLSLVGRVQEISQWRLSELPKSEGDTVSTQSSSTEGPVYI